MSVKLISQPVLLHCQCSFIAVTEDLPRSRNRLVGKSFCLLSNRQTVKKKPNTCIITIYWKIGEFFSDDMKFFYFNKICFNYLTI